MGDEPVLLHRSTRCATVVGRDRVAAAETLVSQGVDVIIADDGLQHLRLARNCEIVVIDGARGFGNQRMLPAGPLREPLSRLADVDLIVVNGAAEHSSLRRMGVQMEMTLRPGEARWPEPAGCPWPNGYLLFAARLQPLKGPDLAIRALAEVDPELRPQLVVAGDVSADFAAYETNKEDISNKNHPGFKSIPSMERLRVIKRYSTRNARPRRRSTGNTFQMGKKVHREFGRTEGFLTGTGTVQSSR